MMKITNLQAHVILDTLELSVLHVKQAIHVTLFMNAANVLTKQLISEL